MSTLDYYNQHADQFIVGTADADMKTIRDAFLAKIPDKGTILDLGCGSGRDSLAFRNAGYHVVAVDGSQELCKRAEKLIGQEVICSTFEDYHPDPAVRFHGIWACASLLHLAPEDIARVVRRLSGSIVSDGYWYMSFKYGDFRGERNGRYFTDMTEESLRNLIGRIEGLEISGMKITGDVRPGREQERWLNALVQVRTFCPG